jgi:hypothetical protein
MQTQLGLPLAGVHHTARPTWKLARDRALLPRPAQACRWCTPSLRAAGGRRTMRISCTSFLRQRQRQHDCLLLLHRRRQTPDFVEVHWMTTATAPRTPPGASTSREELLDCARKASRRPASEVQATRSATKSSSRSISTTRTGMRWRSPGRSGRSSRWTWTTPARTHGGRQWRWKTREWENTLHKD